MTYEAALAALDSYIRYSKGGYGKDTPPEAALQTIRSLVDHLGHPQQSYAVVHVAGTKGKGSVCAMLASMLRAAGYRTGMYSSPHLQDIRERFQVDGRLMSKDQFAQTLASIRPALEAAESPTFFEAATALAFAYFRDVGVDVAVIETGVGGLRDATSVVEPVLSVITNISMDHTVLLGDTIEDIAFEKAGIIKHGVPVICAPQPTAALAVIEAEAASERAPLTVIGRDWIFERKSSAEEIMEAFLAGPAGQALQSYQTALLGSHQVTNSVVALAAVAALNQSGFTISEADAQRGLAAVTWQGRFEVIRRPARSPVVLDSAHNVESAGVLKETLDERFRSYRPRVLVYGAKSTKDISGFLDVLLPDVDHLILTQTTDGATDAPEQLTTFAERLGSNVASHVARHLPDALRLADQLAGDTGVICVTGSVYIVGEARTSLGLHP